MTTTIKPRLHSWGENIRNIGKISIKNKKLLEALSHYLEIHALRVTG